MIFEVDYYIIAPLSYKKAKKSGAASKNRKYSGKKSDIVGNKST